MKKTWFAGVLFVIFLAGCSGAGEKEQVGDDVNPAEVSEDVAGTADVEESLDVPEDGIEDDGVADLDLVPADLGVDTIDDLYIPPLDGCCQSDDDCEEGQFCDANIEACLPIPGEGQCWYNEHCTDGAICLEEQICPCWGEDVHSCKLCRIGCGGPDKMGYCFNTDTSNCCENDEDCWSDNDNDDYEKTCIKPDWGPDSDLGVCVYEPSYWGQGWCWKDSDCAGGDYCHGAALCPCNVDCDMDYEGPGVCLPKGDSQCKPVDNKWLKEWCNAAAVVYFDGEQCVQADFGWCECKPFCEFTYQTMEECEEACNGVEQPPECSVFDGDCDGAIPPQPWWYFDGESCVEEDSCMCEGCPGTFASSVQCWNACLSDQCYPLTDEMEDCADPDALPFWYYNGQQCVVIDGCGYDGPGKWDTQLECMQACMGGGQCQIFDGGCDDAIPEFPWYYFDGAGCVEEDSCVCEGCPGTYMTMQACEAACGLGGFPEFIGAKADCPYIYLIDDLGFGNQMWQACMESRCEYDWDCPDLYDVMSGGHCVFGNCVFCWSDGQCAEDKVCRAGRCVDGTPACPETPECTDPGCRIIHPSERPCPVCVCDTVYGMECKNNFDCLAISSYQYDGCVYGRCGDCRNDGDCGEWGRCLQPGICYEMTPPIEYLYGSWLVGWAGGMDHFSYFRFEPDGTLRRGQYEWEGAWADDQPGLPCWPEGEDFPAPLVGTWEPEVTQSGFLVVKVNLNVSCDSGPGWTTRYNVVPSDSDWYEADFIHVDGDMNYQAFKVGNDVCIPDFTSCQTPTGIY